MPVPVPPVMAPFLEALQFEKRYSPHTIQSYQDDLLQFFTFIETEYGQLPLSALTQQLVRTWLAALKEKKLNAKSINRKISTLKSFFKYQMRVGLLEKSPMVNIVSPKISKRLPVYVEEKDMGELFKYLPFPDNWKGRTDKLLFSIFYQTGIRLSELIGLKETQVDAANQSVKVTGKGNKERIIPVSSELIEDIEAYIKDKRSLKDGCDEHYLLVNEKGKKLYPKYVYLAVTGYLGEVTTLNKKSPHVLRHSFATHLTNHGADINSVKELLGHASLAATQIYTHNSIEKLREVHKKAHPKA
jgi:integrase/recombinase XerC